MTPNSNKKTILIGGGVWLGILLLLLYAGLRAAYAQSAGTTPENQTEVLSLNLKNLAYLAVLAQTFFCLEIGLLFLPSRGENWKGELRTLAFGLLFCLPLFLLPFVFGLAGTLGLSVWLKVALFGCAVFFASHLVTTFWNELLGKEWLARALTQILILVVCGTLFYANPLLLSCKTSEGKLRLIEYVLGVNPIAHAAGIINLDIVRLPFMYHYTEISYHQFKYPAWSSPGLVTACLASLAACFAARLPRYYLERKPK